MAALLPAHETLIHGKPSTMKLRLKELVDEGKLLPLGQFRAAQDVRNE